MPRITRWSVPLALVLLLGCQDATVAPKAQFAKGVGGGVVYVPGPAPTSLATPPGFTEGYARTIDDAGWILGRPKAGYGVWSWHVDAPNTVAEVTTTATPLEASGNARGDVVVNLQGGGDGVLLKTADGYDGPIRLDDHLINGSYMGNAGEIDDGGLVVGSVVDQRPGEPDARQHPAFWVSPTALFQLADEPFYSPMASGSPGERAFTAISASGLVAGRADERLSNGSTMKHSWIWQASKADGVVTVTLLWELPPVPGSSTGDGYSAFSMNAGGTIVGYHYITRAMTTTVRWIPDASAPSGYRATELALNAWYDPLGVNRCGYVATNMPDRGIVWLDGNTVVTLPPLPGGTGSRAKDINANGDVVGESYASSRRGPTVYTPVVWKGAARCP